MEIIRVNEMLTIMDLKGEDGESIPFKFRFVTSSDVKQTGGKRISYDQAVIVGGSNSNSTKRNPNHYQHYTRNFRSVNNNEIRKFHALLVEEFNDMRVVL